MSFFEEDLHDPLDREFDYDHDGKLDLMEQDQKWQYVNKVEEELGNDDWGPAMSPWFEKYGLWVFILIFIFMCLLH